MDKSIYTVVQDGLCTGCGTCVGVCPKDAIEMKINNSKGIYLPYLDQEKCNQCGVCLQLCPGYGVDFNQLNQEIFGRQPNEIYAGNYLNCYIGYATDYNIRYNSASGGLVTQLLIFALEQGIIDGALVTKMREDNPLEPQPFIARSKEEIISASKSKYCPVPANIALKEILKEDGKYAVVGLPCHIQGIRKAQLVNKKLRERIVLHLGIFCSHPTSFWGVKFILYKYGINQDDIARLDYRGEGWPGHMAIYHKNGTKKLIAFMDYNTYSWGLSFFCPMRCTLCFDQCCDLADISFGDAWVSEQINDNIGTSAIISRNIIGENLLKQAVAKGEITLRIVESNKVEDTKDKKGKYEARSFVARFLRKKIPEYRMVLPKSKITTYYDALKLYINILLSRHHLWWLIDKLGYVDRLSYKLQMIWHDFKGHLRNPQR
jgi:coenzyme F420 hydrogenase subunit beta